MSEEGSAIFKLYVDYHNKSIEKYGERSICLMMVGSFYECYSVNTDDMVIGPNLHELSDILNIIVTRKDKSKEHNISNPLMLGFPDHSVNKFKKVLLDEGYTITIIDQVTPAPNPRRDIVEVCSPGTVINDFCRDVDNYLASIWIDCGETNDKKIHTVGISLINVQTGKNIVNHISSPISDENYWQNELNRIMNSFSIVETVVHMSDSVTYSDNELTNIFDILDKCNSFHIYKKDIKQFSKIGYQNEILQKIFKLTGLLSPIEFFNWERKSEVLISYIIMIHHVYLHKADLINNIEQPVELDNIDFLTITSDGVRQLNVVNNNNFYKGRGDSLVTLLNKSKTAMGRREFKERLLAPSMDCDKIEQSYENISLFINDNFYEDIRKHLGKIPDLEKSLRKMGISDMYEPNDLFADFISYDFVKNVINLVIANERLDYSSYQESFNSFNEYYDYINNTFDFDNFGSVSSNNSIEKSIFKKGIYPEIDALDDEITEHMNNIHKICEKFSSMIDTKKGIKAVRYDYNDKHDHFIYCTKKRGLTILEKFNNMSSKSIYIKNEQGDIIYTCNKSNFKLTPKDGSNSIIDLDIIRTISTKLLTLNKQIKNMNKILWDKTIKEIYDGSHDLLKKNNVFIADVDFISCGAYLSITNNYHRPKTDSTADKAFVQSTDMRHPIIESISEKEFIRNDIVLGKDGQDGILLYGVNAGGKSTLMKSIGLNLIMAQAGLYVAAGTFCFKPYKNIFTRIISNDNIFKSQSSFVVECLDIHSFLNSATKDSLVLGDEVCSTTEVSSAISLVSASLKILCEKQSSFMFTSHLSELVNIDEVKELNNLKIYHMSVSFEGEKIIFDRKLTLGVGPNHYGIKIAESLGLDKRFISIANQIQLRLNGDSGHIVNQKKSVYNSNVLMGECEMPGCKNPACETHHIFEQADCDSNGNTGHFHKNKSHNLVPLCTECHAQITYGNLHISGYKETSDGLELQYEYIENKQDNKKKKFNENNKFNIKQYYSRYNKVLSKQKIIDKLESDKGLKVSIKIFNQIINDEY